MNFIITKLTNPNTQNSVWRVHPSGKFHHTLLLLKSKDIKDLLSQIIEEDPAIAHFLKTLLK